jgi:hypothetical protein
MSESKNPRGQVLRVSSRLDGLSTVLVDNGPFSTISIHCRTEDLVQLTQEDTAALVSHLMTRKPGHFRTKPGK